ncbi:hypothetical protein HK100_008333 [Physocladia obscura]|uniref:G-protein coupled receptors family 1 profile domain-containing protein n=1 Tax=Physocladia obscura TaxID=109957 RepID=A0AAD5T5Z3_9FUNG|nr:hypothetical protein HK100_008333 [Physocladia obscura]
MSEVRPWNYPIFWAVYLLYTPTVVLGAMLSGPMLYTILKNQDRLLKNRLDRTVLLLLAVSFAWAISTIIKVTLMLIVANDILNQANAALTYISAIWVLISNVFLALSRYFLIRQWPKEKARIFLSLVSAIAITLSGGIGWVFATSTTDNSFAAYPDSQYKKQISTLLVIGAATVVFCAGMIVGAYSATYLVISRKLKSALQSSSVSPIRLHLQYQVLKAMIIMSSGIIVCYLPIAIVLVIDSLLGKGVVPNWAGVLVTEFTMLDTVVTPLMLLYFMPSIQKAVVAKWRFFARFETKDDPVFETQSYIED